MAIEGSHRRHAGQQLVQCTLQRGSCLLLHRRSSGGRGGSGSGAAIAVEAATVTGAYLDSVADRLSGYSGRAISKLFLALQGTVYGRRDSPVVNKGVVEEVLARKLREPGFGEFQDFAEQRKRVQEPELR